MQIKKIYISDDGEEFETEKACLEHESAIDSSNSILMFDSGGELIKDSKIPYEYDRANYLYILDPEKAEKHLAWINKEYGYPIPENVKLGQLYFFNDFTQKFENLDAFIIKMSDIRNKLLVKATTTKCLG